MASVTEFVILSGPDVHEYLLLVRKQLRQHLAAHFPEYSFSLATQDCEGMGFMVVPVVGTVGTGVSEEFAHPQDAVLFEIKMALEAFQPQVATIH